MPESWSGHVEELAAGERSLQLFSSASVGDFEHFDAPKARRKTGEVCVRGEYGLGLPTLLHQSQDMQVREILRRAVRRLHAGEGRVRARLDSGGAHLRG